MKRIVIINGIIAGVIVSAMLALSLPLHENGILNYNSGTVVGYASMVIALSVIFFAIRRYREHLGGEITFGKAFGVGLAITVIASVIYAVTWEVCYHTIAGDFMARMTDYYVEEKIAAGATAEEVAATRKEMAEFSELYENPAIRFGMTLFEIFPRTFNYPDFFGTPSAKKYFAFGATFCIIRSLYYRKEKDAVRN